MEDKWDNRNYMEELPDFSGNILDVDTESEQRCPYCGRLLFKGYLSAGSSVEVKCLRRECQKIIRIERV